jgi:hypothetical protein
MADVLHMVVMAEAATAEVIQVIMIRVITDAQAEAIPEDMVRMTITVLAEVEIQDVQVHLVAVLRPWILKKEEK